ncbi:MAG: hypothetical protein LBI87_09250 [Candidatus Accumulibacter sp.]|nr:hypothetical protein [Accumulibacter sp.]
MDAAVPCLSPGALRQSGRGPATPFRVRCADGEIVAVSRLLRALPGKRLTGEARWRGQRVLAKLFVARGSRRHWERERRGLGLLREAGLPAPEIVAAGRLDGGGHFLLTGFIEDSRTLADRWPAAEAPPPDGAQAIAALLPAFRLFGQLHAAGLIQTDPHPGNFLERAGELFLIDGDGVERMRGEADERARQARDNLALLLAQLPPAWEDCPDALLAAYASGEPRRVPGRRSLARAVGRARSKRLARFLDKTLRDCSQFAAQRAFCRFSSVVRARRETLAPLLAAPDAAVAAGTLLKDGNTCTVARVDAGGQALVIKRYNQKSLAYTLSRGWFPSRARRAWLAGHRLAFLGIATPAPLALIEERIGPLRRRAFLINEFCPGENLLRRFPSDREPEPAEAAEIRAFFERLFRARITHHDMKATNFLWHDSRLAVLDLDALIQHGHEMGFGRAWRRDRARFLRNWPESSAFHRWLDANLPEAPPLAARGLSSIGHADFLALKAGAEAIESDAHGEKVLRLADGRFLKLFRRKRRLTSAAWRPYARRFVDNAEALARRGIPVPRMIGAWRVASVARDAVLYEPLEGTTLRALVRRGLDAETESRLKRRFTEFVIRLHSLGIYFRSLHLGNVILTPAGEFGLIDFADLRLWRRPLPTFMRRRNIRRMLSIPGERDWIDSKAIIEARHAK